MSRKGLQEEQRAPAQEPPSLLCNSIIPPNLQQLDDLMPATWTQLPLPSPFPATITKSTPGDTYLTDFWPPTWFEQDCKAKTSLSSRFQSPSGDPICPPFPPQGQLFPRMPSGPGGHGSSGGGGPGGGGGGGGGGNGTYNRQHSDPCMPYLQQSFKQEYMDPLYERAAHMAGPGPGPGHGPHPHPHSHLHRFPPAHMMVKQEPTDYTYEPGKGQELQLLPSDPDRS